MTGRPKLITEEEEQQLKNFLLEGIVYDKLKTARELYIMVESQFPQLKEWNIRNYVAKFQLKYKEPFASDEDMQVYTLFHAKLMTTDSQVDRESSVDTETTNELHEEQTIQTEEPEETEETSEEDLE
jgi:hypothetical protein